MSLQTGFKPPSNRFSDRLQTGFKLVQTAFKPAAYQTPHTPYRRERPNGRGAALAYGAFAAAFALLWWRVLT